MGNFQVSVPKHDEEISCKSIGNECDKDIKSKDEKYEMNMAKLGGALGYHIGFWPALRRTTFEYRVLNVWDQAPSARHFFLGAMFRSTATGAIGAAVGALLFSSARETLVMKKAISFFDDSSKPSSGPRP